MWPGESPREGRGMEPLLRALTPFSAASSFPDELSWIMELLEKDSLALQEPLGEQGPFGERPSSILPQPDGPQLGEPGAPSDHSPLPLRPGKPLHPGDARGLQAGQPPLHRQLRCGGALPRQLRRLHRR